MLKDQSHSHGLPIKPDTVPELPVAREDLEDRIELLARRESISHDAAWEKIKTNLHQLLEYGKLEGNWPPTRKQNKSYRVVVSNTNKTSPQHNTLLQALPAPTSHDTDNDFSRLETLMPDELRKQGMSVIEALERGLLQTTGEHPDAKLLRSTLNEHGFSNSDVENLSNPIIAKIRENQLSFPFKLSKTVHILPTDFNQTSLFHVASNNSTRRQFKNELMGTIGESVRIYFQGEELRHDDEAIFMQLLYIARGKMPSTWLYVDNVPFLLGARGIGSKIKKRYYSAKDAANIDASLLRMRSAIALIRNTKKHTWITINIIKELEGTGSTRRVIVDPRIIALLDSYTTMDHDTLYQIKGVSRQLFKYISTKPYSGLYPTKIQSFFELCYGSLDSLKQHYMTNNPDKTEAEVRRVITKKVSDFRRKALPDGLQELQERGLIVSFHINAEEDKVSIIKGQGDTLISPIQPERLA